MNPRTLAAATIALAALTLSQASAATPTTIVYTGPTIFQVKAETELRAYIEDGEGTRLGGPEGSEPKLTFTLGSVTKLGKALPNQSTITVPRFTAPAVGEDLGLQITYAGTDTYAASSLTVPVDVYQYVLVDETGAGMLMLNLEAGEMRVISGGYDSGLLTNVQMTAVGPVVTLDVNATDDAGTNLTLKGVVAPGRSTFAVVGQADEPIVLAAA